MSDLPGYLLLSLRFILALVLYGFLALAIRIVWQELRQTAATSNTRYIPPLLIDLDRDTEKRFSYTNSEVIIGRAPMCDLHIMDDTVSSRHGQFYYKHSQWWYEDLGSSNGSFLNERPVKTATVLTEGDELRLGKIQMMIHFRG